MKKVVNEARMEQASYLRHLNYHNPSDYSTRLVEILRSGSATVSKIGYDVTYTNSQGSLERRFIIKVLPKPIVVQFNPKTKNARSLIGGLAHDIGVVTTFFHRQGSIPNYIPVTNLTNNTSTSFIRSRISANSTIKNYVPYITIDCLEKDGNSFKTATKQYNQGDIYEVVFSFCSVAYLMEGTVDPNTVFGMLKLFVQDGTLDNKTMQMGYTINKQGKDFVRVFNGTSTNNLGGLPPPDNKDMISFNVSIGKLKSPMALTEFFLQDGIETNAILHNQINNTQKIVMALPKFRFAFSRLNELQFNNQVDAVVIQVIDSAAEQEQSGKTDVNVQISFLKNVTQADGSKKTELLPQQSIAISLKDESSQIESGSPLSINKKLNSIFNLGLDPRYFLSNVVATQLKVFKQLVAPRLVQHLYNKDQTQSFIKSFVVRVLEQDDIPVLLKATTQQTMQPGWFEYVYVHANSLQFTFDQLKLNASIELEGKRKPLISLRIREEGSTKRISVDMPKNSILLTPPNWNNTQEMKYLRAKLIRILAQIKEVDTKEFVNSEKFRTLKGDEIAFGPEPINKQQLNHIIMERQRAFRKFLIRVSSVARTFASELTHSSKTFVDKPEGIAAIDYNKLINVLFALVNNCTAIIKDNTMFKDILRKQSSKETGSLVEVYRTIITQLEQSGSELKKYSGGKLDMLQAFGNELLDIAGQLKILA